MTSPSDVLPVTNPTHSPAAPPRELRTWVILAIILGGVGMLLGTANVVSSALQSRDGALEMARTAAAWPEKLGLPSTEKQRSLQAEYTERMIDAQWSLRPWRVLHGTINMVLGTGLVVGGILFLKRRNVGRKLVRAAAWGHVPYEALAIVIGIMTSSRVSGLQGELMMRTMQAGQPKEGADVAMSIASATAQFTKYMGMAMVVAVALGVILFCVLLARLVNKPEVRAWCEA